jgi:hypothetical protein
MKIKKKFQKFQLEQPNEEDVLVLIKKIGEVATLKEKLMPAHQGFGLDISEGMCTIERDKMPICGFIAGTDSEDFLNMVANEVHETICQVR